MENTKRKEKISWFVCGVILLIILLTLGITPITASAATDENDFAIYDVVATEMKYDQTAMQEDIAIYGLFTYEEFCEELGEIPETAFVALGGEHLKVAMGKGLINREKILALIEQYQVFFI